MRSIKNHLLRFGIFYIAIAVATPTLVCYAIDLKFKPQENEIFGLYIANGQSDVESIYNAFEPKMPKGIKEFDIFDYSTSTRNVFDTFGKLRSDLLILPKSFIVDSVAKTLFVPITNALCGSYEPYVIDGSIYGVKIYDSENKTGALENHIPYEQDYFMFINVNSVHKSSLVDSGSYDDLAITMWSEILKDEA